MAELVHFMQVETAADLSQWLCDHFMQMDKDLKVAFIRISSLENMRVEHEVLVFAEGQN